MLPYSCQEQKRLVRTSCSLPAATGRATKTPGRSQDVKVLVLSLPFFLPILSLPLPLFLSVSVSLPFCLSRASLSLMSSCLSPSLNGCVYVYVTVCLLACFFCGCLSGSLLPPVSASLAVCFPPLPPVLHTHCLSVPAGTGCGWTAARRCLVAWTSVLSRLSTAKMAEITS